MQLEGSFNLIAGVISSMTDEEWTARAHADANRLGFTVWHCVRTLDWAANLVARGEPEVADRSGWQDVRPSGSLFGAGVSKQTADAVAREIGRGRVQEYLEAVQVEVQGWLRSLPPADLDRQIDLRAANAGHPEYRVPAVWTEIEDLDGIPLWQFLARPAISHIRVHYGELTAQLEAHRVRPSA